MKVYELLDAIMESAAGSEVRFADEGGNIYQVNRVSKASGYPGESTMLVGDLLYSGDDCE